MKNMVNIKTAEIGTTMRKMSETGDIVKLIHRDDEEHYIVIKHLINNNIQLIRYKGNLRTVFFEA